MHAAFDAALAFAKGDIRRVSSESLAKQVVADLLDGIKMQTGACNARRELALATLLLGCSNYLSRKARREPSSRATMIVYAAPTRCLADALEARKPEAKPSSSFLDV